MTQPNRTDRHSESNRLTLSDRFRKLHPDIRLLIGSIVAIFVFLIVATLFAIFLDTTAKKDKQQDEIQMVESVKELDPYRKQINNIQTKIDDLYLYQTAGEGVDNAFQVVNTVSGAFVSPDGETPSKAAVRNISMDLINKPDAKKSYISEDRIPYYTQSFIKSKIEPTAITTIQKDYDAIEQPNSKIISKNAKTKAEYTVLSNQQKNLDLQIKAIKLKLQIQEKLNNVTDREIYTNNKIDERATLTQALMADDLNQLNEQINALKQLQLTDDYLIANYNTLLEQLQTESGKISAAEYFIDLAIDDPSSESIRTATMKINDIDNAQLKSKYLGQIEKLKESIEKQDALREIEEKTKELEVQIKDAQQKEKELKDQKETNDTPLSDNIQQTKDLDLDINIIYESSEFNSSVGEPTNVKLDNLTIIQLPTNTLSDWSKGQTKTVQIDQVKNNYTITDYQKQNINEMTTLHHSNMIAIAQFINDSEIEIYYLTKN